MTAPGTTRERSTTNTSFLDRLRDRLDAREREGLLRALPRLTEKTKGVIDLRSNDVLRLSAHPRMIEAVTIAAERFGVGAGASRLVAERTGFVRECEARFARFKHAERALFTPTGYGANLALLQALSDPGTLFLLDKKCHASLIDGALLACSTVSGGARLRTFAHNNIDRARELAHRHLERTNDPSVVLVTESVFSMDGDLAPLAELAALRDEINATGTGAGALIVDEAHATGVLGETGAGGDELAGHVADATVSTASKALGALGGIIAGPSEVIDAVLNLGRAFIYTTGIMPAQAAAIDTAVSIIRDEPDRRERLESITRRVRDELADLGVRPFESDPTPIIPIVLGENDRTKRAHAPLETQGVLVSCIRPPTVPLGTSRLRLTLHSELTSDQLETVLRALKQRF